MLRNVTKKGTFNKKMNTFRIHEYMKNFFISACNYGQFFMAWF